MLSSEDFKKSLGPTALKMTESQIEELRQFQDKIAEAIFELWFKAKNNVDKTLENELASQ
jgi:hypothetical protein